MSLRDIVIKNEALIKDLATYDITKGNAIIPESKEDMMELGKKLIKRSTEFKRLLKSGEFTWQELEADVFGKYGITEPLGSSRKPIKGFERNPIGFSSFMKTAPRKDHRSDI